MEAVVERLERLERQNRRLRRGGIVVALAAVSLFGACWLRPSGTVDAERFVLRDKQGRIRIEIAMSYDFREGNPVIRLLDEKGTKLTTLGAGLLRIADGKGVEATLLDNMLQFNNEAGVSARLGGAKEGGSLFLFGLSRGGSILLNADTSGLEISDGDGFRADLGKISLIPDRTGETRQRSAASLVLSGRDDKVLWSAP
jgi:hypothetical protein